MLKELGSNIFDIRPENKEGALNMMFDELTFWAYDCSIVRQFVSGSIHTIDENSIIGETKLRVQYKFSTHI